MVSNGPLYLPQMGFCLRLVSTVLALHTWSVYKMGTSGRGDFGNMQEQYVICSYISINPKKELFYQKQIKTTEA